MAQTNLISLFSALINLLSLACGSSSAAADSRSDVRSAEGFNEGSSKGLE